MDVKGLLGDMQSLSIKPRAGLEIPYEDLDMREQIGGGGFSLVYRALWRGTPVAVKKWFAPEMTEELQAEFRAEMLTLQELRHPHVCQLLGACMRLPNLCLVFEYMPKSLHDVLYGGQVDLDRKRALELAIDIVRAMRYLHARQPPVIHRDIKPGNFLVGRDWRVKITDFGLASMERGSGKTGAGTPAYMAPELLAGGGRYNEKVDVYAFGILLNELLTKQPPFDGAMLGDIKASVAKGERPPLSLTCPRELANLIKDCWAQDSAARPSFDDIAESLRKLGGSSS